MWITLYSGNSDKDQDSVWMPACISFNEQAHDMGLFNCCLALDLSIMSFAAASSVECGCCVTGKSWHSAEGSLEPNVTVIMKSHFCQLRSGAQ